MYNQDYKISLTQINSIGSGYNGYLYRDHIKEKDYYFVHNNLIFTQNMEFTKILKISQCFLILKLIWFHQRERIPL